MNRKTSINSICRNLWAPTASLLQGLTALQQCVNQKKFRNVCKVKKWLVEPVFVWSRTLSILLSSEWRKRLLAYICIVGQHFKQFYHRQLTNGQLNEMSATVSEMWTKCVFMCYVNKAIISHWIKKWYFAGCFLQVVQKQTLGEVRNSTVISWQIVSEIFVPKIINIW